MGDASRGGGATPKKAPFGPYFGQYRVDKSGFCTRAAERWERWERVPSQFEILAAILADDLRTFVAK